jgi:hypothetical protein
MFQIVGCLPGNYPGGFSVLPFAGNPALYTPGLNPPPFLPPGIWPPGGNICPLQLIPDVPFLDQALGWSTNIKPQICNTVGGVVGGIPVVSDIWQCLSGC